MGVLLAAPAIVKVSSIMPVKALPQEWWSPEIELGDLVYKERYAIGWTSWKVVPSFDNMLEVHGRHEPVKLKDEILLGLWNGERGVTVAEFEELQKLHNKLAETYTHQTPAPVLLDDLISSPPIPWPPEKL
jgi:hypothetical protein